MFYKGQPPTPAKMTFPSISRRWTHIPKLFLSVSLSPLPLAKLIQCLSAERHDKSPGDPKTQTHEATNYNVRLETNLAAIYTQVRELAGESRPFWPLGFSIPTLALGGGMPSLELGNVLDGAAGVGNG